MLNIKQAILLCKLIEIGFDKLSPPPPKKKQQTNKNTSIEKKKQKMLLRTFDRDFF